MAGEEVVGQGGAQVAPQVTPQSVGGGVGGEQAAAVEGQVQGEPQVDPWAQELPPAVAEKFGVKTFGEAFGRYQASSREAQQLAERTQAMQAIAEYQEQQRKQQLELLGQTQHPQTPPIEGPYYGFRTVQEYAEAFNRDPVATERRRLAWAQQNGLVQSPPPELATMQQQLQRTQQALMGQSRERQWAEVQARDPEFRDGTPLWKTAAEILNGEAVWLKDHYHDPSSPVNVPQVLHDLALAKMQQTQQQGAQARMAALRQQQSKIAGGGVRPGQQRLPPPKTNAEAILRAKAQLEANGQEVPPDMLRAAMDATRGG